MVYYGILTYCRRVKVAPVLFILGSYNCGKSWLLDTLFPMCDGSRQINGNTYATIRDELDTCPTAFIDENEKLPEGLLRRRFMQSNSAVRFKAAVSSGGYQDKTANVFGYTVIAKRYPFKDVALQSRCIIITPEQLPLKCSGCRITDVGSLVPVVQKLELPTLDFEAAGRVMQMWRPLAAIAKRLGDDEWTNWAAEHLKQETEIQNSGRIFEPREAVLRAYEQCDDALNSDEMWVKLTDIKNTANTESGLHLKPNQISEILQRAGIKMHVSHGYPVFERISDKLRSEIEEVLQEAEEKEKCLR